MKKQKLPSNPFVIFNEEEHTYTTKFGDQLSGITSIIHKYLFPAMYDGISSSVMEAARARGQEVHKALEDLFHGIAISTDLPIYPVIAAYEDIAKKNKFKQIAAEYLISDNEHIATCIDSVLQTKEGAALVDYKTTSVLYTEYLQWQLSIEAILFEKQTGIKVTNLYAVHLPKIKDGVCNAKLIEIERLPDEYVKALIAAYVAGDETFDNPVHKLSDDTNELLKQYKDAEVALIELNASVEYYKNIQADIKAKIKEQMDEESASKWENDSVTITRSKDSVRKTFKLELLNEKPKGEEVQKWLDSNLPSCYAETKVNGNVTIKFK